MALSIPTAHRLTPLTVQQPLQTPSEGGGPSRVFEASLDLGGGLVLVPQVTRVTKKAAGCLSGGI